MTRIVYMGGEPMKYKCVIVVALSVFACFGGITTNRPGVVVHPTPSTDQEIEFIESMIRPME